MSEGAKFVNDLFFSKGKGSRALGVHSSFARTSARSTFVQGMQIFGCSWTIVLSILLCLKGKYFSCVYTRMDIPTSRYSDSDTHLGVLRYPPRGTQTQIPTLGYSDSDTHLGVLRLRYPPRGTQIQIPTLGYSDSDTHLGVLRLRYPPQGTQIPTSGYSDSDTHLGVLRYPPRGTQTQIPTSGYSAATFVDSVGSVSTLNRKRFSPIVSSAIQ